LMFIHRKTFEKCVAQASCCKFLVWKSWSD